MHVSASLELRYSGCRTSSSRDISLGIDFWNGSFTALQSLLSAQMVSVSEQLPRPLDQLPRLDRHREPGVQYQRAPCSWRTKENARVLTCLAPLATQARDESMDESSSPRRRPVFLPHPSRSGWHGHDQDPLLERHLSRSTNLEIFRSRSPDALPVNLATRSAPGKYIVKQKMLSWTGFLSDTSSNV